MKKIFTLIALGLLAVSCAKFTDLKPKGKNMLSSADDLELLLNIDYDSFNRQLDLFHLTGDLMCNNSNIANMIASPTPTRWSILTLWDESNIDKLPEMTAVDEDYNKFYGYIGKIANPILNSIGMGFTTGDESKIRQIEAEALCLRAWSAFLLVNKFAPAYNPATAASTPGIAFPMEDEGYVSAYSQWTVQKVYDQIVADCTKAIELNSLPVQNINQMRWSKACPYAIKALALMGMQRFDEAETAAKESLKVNDAIADYWSSEYTRKLMPFMPPFEPTMVTTRKPLECEEDLFHTFSELTFGPLLTPECENALERGHSAKTRMPNDFMAFHHMLTPGFSMGMTSYGLPYPSIGSMGTGANESWNTYGLKTTHQYLIVAECEIRKGNFSVAMDYLDAIRVKRIDPAIYAPLKGAVSDKARAIECLKSTALGENVYSVFNFIERKRWNQLDDMKETITKKFAISDKEYNYSLSPDSRLWTFPFPVNVVDSNPNLTNNI